MKKNVYKIQKDSIFFFSIIHQSKVGSIVEEEKKINVESTSEHERSDRIRC